MKEIKCPHCGQLFTIDESNYDSIVKQIRDHEFYDELKKRETEYNEKLELQKELVTKDLMGKATVKLNEQKAEIESLKNQLKLVEKEHENELNLKTSSLKEEINTLNATRQGEIDKITASKDIEISELKSKANATVLDLKSKIEVLNQQVKNGDTEKELAVNKAISELKETKDLEINKAKNELEIYKSEMANKFDSMKDSYEQQLSAKQELVDYYKDFKTKMSTKMIGESLEQHCANEFNKNRMGMFRNAYFEKDNEVVEGSKGDFVFRDFDEDGVEIISIMFEMKNEADTTSTKHKNEDFFDKLDKDRNRKKCEYAVLVSLLESDSELYNEGIVDVSYRYPKMYVIRPQFFIPLITLLRNAALNATEYKKQLLIEKNNNLDIAHFEENMENFKVAFGKNFETASKKFSTAIDEIDKTIDHLKKVKENLLSSDRQLRLANDKAQDLTIKKLTKNAPSLAEKFSQAPEKKSGTLETLEVDCVCEI